MKLSVFGGTGGVGREVIAQSLTRGHEIQALLRSPGKLAIDDPGLTVISGDARNPDDILRTITGSDAVLSSLGTDGLGKTTIYSHTIGLIIDAMHQTGISRFIGVGAAGQDPERSHNMPLLGRVIVGLLLKPTLRDMYQMQGSLEGSDIEWTLVWPPRLSDGPMTGSYRHEVDEAVPRGSVLSRADVAHFMLDCLEETAFIRRRVAIAY